MTKKIPDRLYADFIKAIDDYAPAEGLHKSNIERVLTAKYSRQNDYVKRQWHASLAIIAQGSKEILLENEICPCDPAHYTATLIPLPVASRVAEGSPDKPFLGILIEFNPDMLNEIANQIENYPEAESNSPARAMYSGKADDKMLAAAIRLTKLLRAEPEDARFFAPLIIKELFYYLLKSADGAAIRQYIRSGSEIQRISQAVHRIKTELDQEINIAGLSKTAQMSRSAFFKCFKEVTTLSPIQFQKRLRLLEAKRLMRETGETAERSAYRVGYKSASQFSREYSRMFGGAPAKNKKSVESARHHNYRE